MRFADVCFYITHDIKDGSPSGKRRVITAVPQTVEDGTPGSYASELEALIAGHQRIIEDYRKTLNDYGPGPYYAVYVTGMVLPHGEHQFKAQEAELYAGPFATWTQYHQFLHENVPLANEKWHWGKAPFFTTQDEFDQVVAVLGQPEVEPDIYKSAKPAAAV